MNTIIKAVSIATIFCLGSPVLAKDKYTVALDGTFAPHAMPKLGGGIEGFNVDLANIIGDRLGVEMNIVATQWSGILPGLQAGTYDFVVAPTTITEERAGSLLFSEGYLNTDFQFLVANNAPEITDIKEFKGKVIAVNKGSAYDRWARNLESEIGWVIESYGTNTDAVQAVVSGRAFANVAGNTVSAFAAKKNPNVKLSYLFSTGKVWGMPFRKDDAPDGHEYQTLHKAHKGFAYYFKGPYTKMNQMKRESMFVNMLESLHGDEAELVVAAKDKSMNYKGITKLLCKEVWPNLIVK